MKTIIIISIAWLLSISFVIADPVSQEDAQKIAISWYNNVVQITATDFSIENIFPVSQDDLVTMYIFNFKSGGFVLVAADDASIPILGYSEKNPFPKDILCPAVREWLDDYSFQINQFVKKGISNSETKPLWNAIINGNIPKPTKDVDPLLTTTWDQGCYYNELCPVDPNGPCGHTVTGCVATAMAQIMKYHNFPAQGVGLYSYTHPYYGLLSVDFGNTICDWASMPDNLTSSNIPVATIMYHAGVSVNMNYGPNESGTYDRDVKKSLVDFFNYDPEIQWLHQSDYPDIEDWKSLIRADLDNQLPVYYSGRDPDIGHAFICDGYHISDDKFHFNWGWGGTYNGWYALGELNTAWGSWNLDNVILTYIKPNNPDLISRITHPADNFVAKVGSSIEIKAATVHGNADNMIITIDEIIVATSASNSISYIWNTEDTEPGAYNIKSWSFVGNDSVYFPINLNIAKWETQASGFLTNLKEISYISAVDSNVVWATALDVIGHWEAPSQSFTRTIDGGVSWIAGNIPNCEGLTMGMIQGISIQKAYVTMYRTSGSNPQGIYVTEDGGYTWEHQISADFSNTFSWACSVHFFNNNDGWCMGDPVSGGGGFEMYTTINGGTNWIQVPATNMPSTIPTEYAYPDGFSIINDTIWFGTCFGRILKSTDKGYTWTVTEVNGMNEEFFIPVFRNGSHGLAFTVYASPKLYETFDGGVSWEQVNFTGPLFQRSIAYIPGTANTWVSTMGEKGFNNNGASYSEDGGQIWTVFPGTKDACFRQMDWINPRCGWAGSYNLSENEGGMFKFVGDMLTPASSIKDYAYSSTLSVFPNPTSGIITLRISNNERGRIICDLYEISGVKVKGLMHEVKTPGTYKMEVDLSDLPVGVYFCVLKTNKGTYTTKLIKL